MRFALPASLIVLAMALPASAQETRIAPDGHVPPPAQMEDVAWLAGNWSGPGIRGAPSHEAWLPPGADTMVGLFVQENGEGGLMFTEHMYISEVDGSLAVRLKHFNPDLIGWEEREEMLTFRLVALEPCAAYFSGLTYRCANGENTQDGIVVAVRMSSEGPEVQELRFDFAPVGVEPAPVRCPDAMNTMEINDCYADILDRAEARRAEYHAAALARHADDEEVARMLGESEQAFNEYRDAECAAMYQRWIGGSIRNVMALQCQIAQTDARTHTIWENWLTYPDSTPPDLPEPQPTQ